MKRVNYFFILTLCFSAACVHRSWVTDTQSGAVGAQLPFNLLCIALFVLGVYHLLAYRPKPELREYFWYGVLALEGSFYFFLRTGWNSLLENSLFQFKNIEPLLIFAMAATSVELLQPQMPQPARKWTRIYQCLQVVAAALILVPGVRLDATVLYWWQIVTIPVALLVLFFTAQKARYGPPSSVVLACGLFLLILFPAIGTSFHPDFSINRNFALWGLSAFLLAPALSFGLRMSRLHTEFTALRQNVEQRVRDRTRQIAERTRELTEANAKLTERSRELVALNQKLSVKTRELVEASLAKSQFLANMSHELRTPLNAIIGYSEMLLEEAEEENHNSVQDLQKINSAGKHLLSLISEILDLSKIEAGKMDLNLETFDLKQMVEEVITTIHPLVEKNQNAFEFKASPGLGTMHADLTKARQILFNLLSNACKFTEHGVIRLEVSRRNEDGLPWINFLVSDTGIGMTQQQIDKLFRPFSQADASTTRKYGGTGLGLAISQRFSEMMGGSISVKSEFGAGSVFTVRIPAEVLDMRATPAEIS